MPPLVSRACSPDLPFCRVLVWNEGDTPVDEGAHFPLRANLLRLRAEPLLPSAPFPG